MTDCMGVAFSIKNTLYTSKIADLLRAYYCRLKKVLEKHHSCENLIMSVPWVPVESDSLGKLPAFHKVEIDYDLGQVPAEAKEVLIYTFITSHDADGAVERGFFEISTSDGGKQFKQYMNVATGKDVTIVNSVNVWLPMPKDKVLKVKLYHPRSDKSEKKSIAGKLADSNEWSDVFIIGYRL